MTEHDEAGPKAGPDAATTTIATPARCNKPVVDAGRVARWLEAAEYALDNEAERVDVLLDLSESLETTWLALCERESVA